MGATLNHIFNLLSLSCILLLSPAGGAKALASDGPITGAQRIQKAELQALSVVQHKKLLPWGPDDSQRRRKHDRVLMRNMLEGGVKPSISITSTTPQTGGQHTTSFELKYQNAAKPVATGAKQQGKQQSLRDIVAGAVAATTFAPGKDNRKRDEMEAPTSATKQRGVTDNVQRVTVSHGSGGGSKPAAVKLAGSISAAVLPGLRAAGTLPIAVAALNATAGSRGKRSAKKAVSATAFFPGMRYQRPHSALMASRLTFLHAMDHWRSHGGGNAAAAVAAARRLRGGAAALAAAKRLRGARHDGGGGGGSPRSSGSTAAVVPRW